MHGAELIAIELMTVNACAQLAEEHRFRALPFYHKHDERHQQSRGY